MGPGELFGVLTQRPQGLSPFIRRISASFFRVGLCSRGILKCRTRGIVICVRCDRDD